MARAITGLVSIILAGTKAYPRILSRTAGAGPKSQGCSSGTSLPLGVASPGSVWIFRSGVCSCFDPSASMSTSTG